MDCDFPLNHRQMLALLHAIQSCAVALWAIWVAVAFRAFVAWSRRKP